MGGGVTHLNCSVSHKHSLCGLMLCALLCRVPPATLHPYPPRRLLVDTSGHEASIHQPPTPPKSHSGPSWTSGPPWDSPVKLESQEERRGPSLQHSTRLGLRGRADTQVERRRLHCLSGCAQDVNVAYLSQSRVCLRGISDVGRLFKNKVYASVSDSISGFNAWVPCRSTLPSLPELNVRKRKTEGSMLTPVRSQPL